MRNLPKMWLTVLAGGIVGAVLGIGYGYPLERVLFVAGMSALLMFLLLIILRSRP